MFAIESSSNFTMTETIPNMTTNPNCLTCFSNFPVAFIYLFISCKYVNFKLISSTLKSLPFSMWRKTYLFLLWCYNIHPCCSKKKSHKHIYVLIWFRGRSYVTYIYTYSLKLCSELQFTLFHHLSLAFGIELFLQFISIYL